MGENGGGKPRGRLEEILRKKKRPRERLSFPVSHITSGRAGRKREPGKNTLWGASGERRTSRTHRLQKKKEAPNASIDRNAAELGEDHYIVPRQPRKRGIQAHRPKEAEWALERVAPCKRKEPYFLRGPRKEEAKKWGR